MDRQQQTIAEIRQRLAAASTEELKGLIESLRSDPRAGVRTALDTASRRVERAQAEAVRLDQLYSIEAEHIQSGMSVVVGVDEVGRGALAGPVTAGAVVLPAMPRIEGLDDSKRLSPDRREELASVIDRVAIASGVGHTGADEIDRIGIAAATKLAMVRALEALNMAPDLVLVDGNPVGLPFPERSIVGGDRMVACISAASVIAKVCRDDLMRRYAERYSIYGFDINKGYGTAEHVAAITQHGPSDIHRLSFAPCRQDATLF